MTAVIFLVLILGIGSGMIDILCIKDYNIKCRQKKGNDSS